MDDNHECYFIRSSSSSSSPRSVRLCLFPFRLIVVYFSLFFSLFVCTLQHKLILNTKSNYYWATMYVCVCKSVYIGYVEVCRHHHHHQQHQQQQQHFIVIAAILAVAAIVVVSLHSFIVWESVFIYVSLFFLIGYWRSCCFPFGCHSIVFRTTDLLVT